MIPFVQCRDCIDAFIWAGTSIWAALLICAELPNVQSLQENQICVELTAETLQDMAGRGGGIEHVDRAHALRQ
jgi:hypothetical protein